jgi:hypothetical protein
MTKMRGALRHSDKCKRAMSAALFRQARGTLARKIAGNEKQR